MAVGALMSRPRRTGLGQVSVSRGGFYMELSSRVGFGVTYNPSIIPNVNLSSRLDTGQVGDSALASISSRLEISTPGPRGPTLPDAPQPSL